MFRLLYLRMDHLQFTRIQNYLIIPACSGAFQFVVSINPPILDISLLQITTAHPLEGMESLQIVDVIKPDLRQIGMHQSVHL